MDFSNAIESFPVVSTTASKLQEPEVSKDRDSPPFELTMLPDQIVKSRLAIKTAKFRRFPGKTMRYIFRRARCVEFNILSLRELFRRSRFWHDLHSPSKCSSLLTFRYRSGLWDCENMNVIIDHRSWSSFKVSVVKSQYRIKLSNLVQH